MMSINAVKGVEIGDGFASVASRGSEHRDAMAPDGFRSNHAGGILGGISSGQQVVCSVAFKPTSSLRLPVDGVAVPGTSLDILPTGHHHPSLANRATPHCAAILATVLLHTALPHPPPGGAVVQVAPP